MPYLLLVSVFAVATCGLIYELIAGTLASYLLGDSVTQFSTIIGAYLFSMGIGSFLSKYFNKNLLGWFIQIEILVGLVGGTSSSILFILFENVESFRFLLYSLVGLTGVFVGLEIPLLMRILKNRFTFKDLVSQVFTFDYIGALLASIIFPLVLIPQLGLVKTSYLFGAINISVALIFCFKFARELKWASYLKLFGIISLGIMITGFILSEKIISISEQMAYQDKIIFAKSSPYQRIILTSGKHDTKLFLNGNLQFSSADEYRYHEALIHPGMSALESPENILILGGGDGMGLREILKYKSVKKVILVDLDKEVTRLFKSSQTLKELNGNALNSEKLKIINKDAFTWLKSTDDKYDFIVIDFPDPSNYSVGKLYTDSFYKLIESHLANKGIVTVQATSPFFAPKSFWCINNTIESAGLLTTPFHTYVPSFGEWGYILGAKGFRYAPPSSFPEGLKFLSPSTFNQMLDFPLDMQNPVKEINKLNNQLLVHYYENEWGKFN